MFPRPIGHHFVRCRSLLRAPRRISHRPQIAMTQEQDISLSILSIDSKTSKDELTLSTSTTVAILSKQSKFAPTLRRSSNHRYNFGCHPRRSRQFAKWATGKPNWLPSCCLGTRHATYEFLEGGRNPGDEVASQGNFWVVLGVTPIFLVMVHIS